METRRLKNIAILILVLLDVFLLGLLGYRDLQGQRVDHDAVEELKELYASEKLTLTVSGSDLPESLVPLTLRRQTDREGAIASFLLGESVTGQSQGGGINSYDGSTGTVRFRAGGGFDTANMDRPMEDAVAFARQFCDKFDYRNIVMEMESGTGTVTAVQHVAGVPVLGCSVVLTFKDNCLVAAAGAHVDLSDAATDSEEHLNCVSALVSFLDHRRSAGVVCSEVNGVRCVYQLHSTAAQPKLLPVWEIDTDTYTYQVDGITAAVSRK